MRCIDESQPSWHPSSAGQTASTGTTDKCPVSSPPFDGPVEVKRWADIVKAFYSFCLVPSWNNTAQTARNEMNHNLNMFWTHWMMGFICFLIMAQMPLAIKRMDAPNRFYPCAYFNIINSKSSYFCPIPTGKRGKKKDVRWVFLIGKGIKSAFEFNRAAIMFELPSRDNCYLDRWYFIS